jgi:hypothetical protein
MDVWEEMSGKTEVISGIRDRNSKQQLCLRKERTFGCIFRKSVELEIVK